MKILAHRGANHRATENTMDAFYEALKCGADGIELDVRLCGSGEPVVFHDATMWRICRKMVSIRHTSLERLQGHSLDNRGRQIPTLAEVLEAFAGKVQLILDLKGEQRLSSGLERAVTNVILKHAPDCIDNIVVSSSSAVTLSKVHELFKNKKPELAQILDKKLLFPNISHRLLQFDAVHIEDKLATIAKISAWKRRGLKVRVWTINSVYGALRMRQNGADDILTDVPEKLI